ncbi:cyclin-D1-binding protein 1 homolog [Clytia hemisphaerica]|uniref:Uncharacterized protein n=1 Tax=Clytia hemisphaerica TaxID=252671 RepID=A0A7M6DNJ9_9CNID
MESKATFDEFAHALKQEIDAIQCKKVSCEEIVPEDYNKQTHWQKMDLCCELIAKECTKMALAFSKPPYPPKEDSMLLLRDVSKSVDMLLAWYKCFPLDEGQLLHDVLEKCVLSVLTSVASFTDSTLNMRKSDSMISTGSVWEHCKQFKSLPDDNIKVALSGINSSYSLITDAIEEIHQTIRDHDQDLLDDIDDDDAEDDFNEKWTEDDKNLMKPVLGLLMASKCLLKKIKSALNKIQVGKNSNIPSTIGSMNKEIDRLVLDHIQHISPSVDDLVMVIYPPLQRKDLHNFTNKLTDLLKKTLEFLRNSSLGTDADNQTWIDFIHKAVDHNLEKLNQLL